MGLFFVTLTFFSCNALGTNPLKGVSMNNPYAKLCVLDVAKNIYVKVFNLISRTNETRHIKWHESCKCKCRLDASVCNNKQRWNKNKCRCECKELIGKGRCGGICDYECDKSCDVGQYLGYKNCKCRKKLVDKLVEECNENIDGNEMIYNDYGEVCNSCTIYIVLLAIILIISKSISSAFFNFHWYLKKVIPILLLILMLIPMQ